MRTVASLLAIALVGLTACETPARDEADPRAQPRVTPSAEQTPGPERGRRAPSLPRRPKVFLGAMDGFRDEVRVAILDLKRIGMWRDLSEHLYRIDMTVRGGAKAVKPDRHLADARFWRMTIASGTYQYPVGRFCHVRFFPAAMKEDLARWSSYHARGVAASPPPTERQFWAAIMGHELFHCPKRGAETTPEHRALALEGEVVEALRANGIE